jgi:Family of unknown function (DUF6165)
MNIPLVPTSWGELLDKITILEIKAERLTSTDALANVRRELAELHAAAERIVQGNELSLLKAALKAVNESLWTIEDDIREREAQQDFGDDFVQLARSVYRTNDERGRIKRAINQLLKSDLVEEKQYQAY